MEYSLGSFFGAQVPGKRLVIVKFGIVKSDRTGTIKFQVVVKQRVPCEISLNIFTVFHVYALESRTIVYFNYAKCSQKYYEFYCVVKRDPEGFCQSVKYVFELFILAIKISEDAVKLWTISKWSKVDNNFSNFLI